jgi:hypothetical protein
VPGPCNEIDPELRPIQGGHVAACHYAEELVGLTVEEFRHRAEADDLTDDAELLAEGSAAVAEP